VGFSHPTVETARHTDIARYVEFAQAAQSFLRSKGLAQWVPAAHPAFLPNLAAKVERHSLRKVSHREDAIAFFDFSFVPGAWWSGRDGMAGYISGIVVARASRGLGIGSFILESAEAEVRDHGAHYLRLDCHAGNDWLCEYYRSKGFAEVARVEQHPAISALCIRRSFACNHVTAQRTGLGYVTCGRPVHDDAVRHRR
jgi:GNAT superfamily N-acetyltransferase